MDELRNKISLVYASTVEGLRKLAKDEGIKGYSKMNRSTLIQTIETKYYTNFYGGTEEQLAEMKDRLLRYKNEEKNEDYLVLIYEVHRIYGKEKADEIEKELWH